MSRGDANGFEEFRTRVANHGILPAVPGNSSYSSNGAAHRPNTMAPSGVSRGYHAGAPPARREFCPSEGALSISANDVLVMFKASPFYDEVETILQPVELPGRHSHFSYPHLRTELTGC